MARARTHFLCRQCGSVHPQWMGKCPDCGAWDALEKFTEPKRAAATAPAGTLVETWADLEAASGVAESVRVGAAVPLPDIRTDDLARIATGIGELDRVLGGGFVSGSIVLFGGEPGIGKSTLLLQAAGRLAGRDCGHDGPARVLYVTSEESAYQVRLRAERLFSAHAAGDVDARLRHLYVLADTNLARIVEQARSVRPTLMVIDSVQMIYKPDLDAAPGSITQLRRCCTELVYLAKLSGIAVAVVGHVTKDGQLAGPKLLEHLVDAVLSFEGDRHHAHRVVRGVKNRFGTTLEIGLFEMTGGGLVEISETTGLLDPAMARPGSVVCPAIHGTRCLLVELQALTATGFLGHAKRKTSGLDPNRLAMLIAVLEKHGGLRLADQDVFASAVGGLKVVDPGADLALCLAVAGTHYKRSLGAGVAAVGEVGLGGEVRALRQLEQRARQVVRCGYRTLLVPAEHGPVPGIEAELLPVRRINDAISMLSP